MLRVTPVSLRHFRAQSSPRFDHMFRTISTIPHDLTSQLPSSMSPERFVGRQWGVVEHQCLRDRPEAKISPYHHPSKVASDAVS